MFLFILLTLLTFVNSFASRIVSLILNFVLHDKAVKTISSDLLQLKKDLNQISMVDEFAKYARLQRKIIKLEEEKKSLIAVKASKIAKIKQALLLGTYGITSGSLFILVCTHGGESIAKLPSEWLWPVPKIFSWFSDDVGCISIPSWIIISSTAFKIFAKNF